MPLVAEGPPKVCPECGFSRPRKDFYGRRAANGMVYASSLCKEHDKARIMAGQAANPERTRAAHKRLRDKRVNDPERAAIQRDHAREHMRRKLGITPDRYRVGKGGHSGGKRLDPAPFAAWLRTVGSTPTEISLVVGIEEAQVRRYLDLARRPCMDVVDRALLNAGTLIRLDDLYQPEELEGD